MLLSQYLETYGLSLRELARRCGTSPSTMLRVRDRLVVPSRRVMMAIHRETAGAVTVAEMIELTHPGINNDENLQRDGPCSVSP